MSENDLNDLFGEEPEEKKKGLFGKKNKPKDKKVKQQYTAASTPRQENITNTIKIFNIATMVAAAYYFLMAIFVNEWPTWLAALWLVVFLAITMVAGRMNRRGNSDRAINIVLIGLWVNVVLLPFLVTGLGLITLVTSIVFTLLIVAQTMEGRTLPTILVSVAAGVLSLFPDYFLDLTYRSEIPGQTVFITLLLASITVLLFDYIRKEYVNFSIQVKLITLTIGLGLAGIVFVGALSSYFGSQALTQSSQTFLTSVGKSAGSQLVLTLRTQFRGLEILGQNVVLQDAADAQNATYLGKSPAEIQAELNRLDERWVNSSEGSSFIQQYVTNPSAEELREFLSNDPGTLELFITDKYGGLISAADPTSDYYQADEDWWQAAWNDGKGALFLSEPEYDESTGETSFLLARPLYGHLGNDVVGIVRATIPLSTFTNALQVADQVAVSTGELEDFHSYILFHDGGTAVDDNADQVEDEYLVNTMLSHLGEGFYEDVFEFGEAHYFVESRLEIPETSIDPLFNALIEATDWHVVATESKEEALAAVETSNRTNILGALLFSGVVAGLAALASQLFTRPILELRDQADAIASGNFDVRLDVGSTDEIGVLGGTFNNLAIQLGEFVQNLEKQNIELGVRGAEMEASQRVTFAASERTTPGDLLNLVVNLIRDQFDLYHAQVYMLNEEKDTAVLQESTGYAGRVLLQRNHQIPMEQASLVTSSIRTKEPVLVAETAKDSNWLPNELLPETKSELVVPLLLEGEVLGALDIQSREPGYFTERSVPIFQQMMNQVAFLFENSELVEEITAQTQTLEAFADQLRTAADIGSRLATILEPNRLLTEAVNQLQDRFGYYHAHIYLVDAEGENLEMAAGAGEVGRVLKERGHTIPMDREGSMVATAARNRAPVVANDVTKNPDHLPNPLLPDTRAEVAIPLISGESLVGVLDVQSEQVNRFPSANVDTLLTLGGQIASSVQNATLFRAAETATARVTNLVESAPAAIITMDQRQNIVFFNPGATQIFGYTPEEAIGKPLTFLMPERAHGVHNQEVEGFRREEVATRFMSSRRDIAGRRKDGTVFPAEAGISKMEIDGEVLYTAFLYDITERKSAQEAIVQGDRLKSDFLANMSHELRTPLNSIIGYTDVLLMGLDGELDEEIVTDVQAIHDNGQHLLSLINDILDLAKIEAGRMTLDVSPVDVTGLLEEIKKNAAGLLFNKPVEMLVETSDNLPMINGDRHRLYQVVTNLVSNAVKFTDEGSITLRAYQDNGHVVMEVADTGVGIAPDALDEIFEEFTQADTSSTRQYEGTGLGLTITRRLVRMHQGEISVASELGRGSTFALRIPTNPQFDPEHVSQMPAGQSTNGSM